MTLVEGAVEIYCRHVSILEYPSRILTDSAQTLAILQMPACAKVLLKEETVGSK